VNAPVDVSNASVVEFPLSDDEAFTWLSRRAAINTTLSELAHHWGWNRSKVLRRLRRWETQGRLKRAVRSDGRSAIRVNTRRKTWLAQASSPALAGNAVDCQNRGAPLPMVADSKYDLATTLSASVLIALALVLAGVGLSINASFATSLGKTPEAAILMAALGIVADGLALILPTVACQLWYYHRHPASVMAWVIWTVTLCIALMAAVGFAATNITDTVAARGLVVVQHEHLRDRIERLRTERRSIDEQRAVATIESRIQLAQPSAQVVWKATSGCHDVTLPKSGQACAEVLRLREALGAAQRRDVLDLELKEAEAKLTDLPTVAIADPQAETTAKLVDWLTRNVVTFSPSDVHMVRIFGMMVLPQLAGLVLMFAMALWQSHKRSAA
jgi:hypothetical protein